MLAFNCASFILRCQTKYGAEATLPSIQSQEENDFYMGISLGRTWIALVMNTTGKHQGRIGLLTSDDPNHCFAHVQTLLKRTVAV